MKGQMLHGVKVLLYTITLCKIETVCNEGKMFLKSCPVEEGSEATDILKPSVNKTKRKQNKFLHKHRQ